MALRLRRFRVVFGVLDRTSVVLAVAAVMLVAANAAITASLIGPRIGESVVRLRYAAAFGVDWAAAWWKALVFPGVGLAVLAVNSLFAGRLSARHRAFGALVWGMTCLVEVVFAAAAFIAWQLNA